MSAERFVGDTYLTDRRVPEDLQTFGLTINAPVTHWDHAATVKGFREPNSMISRTAEVLIRYVQGKREEWVLATELVRRESL